MSTLFISVISNAQPWMTNGNSTLPGQFIGTTNPNPFRIFTSGVHRASFTWDGTETAYGSLGICNGLRIFNQSAPTNPIGVLDLLTSQDNKTHVGFGRNGSITGAGNADRMEYYAKGLGFWFNAMDPASRVIWTRAGVENARMGVNGYWRFGANPFSADAARRVELVDGSPQLRLTNTTGGLAELFTRTDSKLLIMPSGNNTGFTNFNDLSYNPTERIDVNGTGRFRIVPTGTANCLLIGSINSGAGDITMKRLDFTGNNNQVLLGNGTWGALSTVNSAANGAWVNSSNDIEWGTNPLLHATIIPMANQNVLFSSFANTTSTFTIGGLAQASNARLFVDNDYFQNALYVKALSTTTLPTKYGIYTSADNASRLTAILGLAQKGDQVQGMYGVASEGTANTTGVRGSATSSFGSSINYGGDFVANGGSFWENAGVRGYADGSVKTNFGGKFKAGGSGSLSIGVYAEATQPANGTPYAAYFSGGTVTTGGSLWASDSTLKENITPITNLDSLLMAIQPVSFDFLHTGNAARLNLPEGLRFGLLAQQLEPIFPGLVQEATHPAEYDSVGIELAPSFTYKVVDMTQLIPILVYDVQKKSGQLAEQQQQIQYLTSENESQDSTINLLNDRLTQLENCLSALLPTLCSMNQSLIESNSIEEQEAVRAQLNVKLSDRSSLVIDQNVPNPFAEQTVINFSIPATVQKAQIHFYNGEGRLIQSVDIVERGAGSLIVFGSDLSSGIYTYTLIADGQVVATKKMMKN